MSGTVYIEVAGTGEKRQHTEASLLKRMAAVLGKDPKEAKKILDTINKGEIVDIPRATFRQFSLTLDTGYPYMPIPQALDTGAWGKVVPLV